MNSLPLDHQHEKTSKEGALFIDIEGTSLTADDIDILKSEQVGGVIFFARNYVSPEQILELTGAIREVRSELVLTVDQEGGRVQRFQAGMTRLPSFARLAEAGAEACEEMAWLMCREILELDIDLSFTPVLDINYGRNSVIANRSFGSNADAVVQCATSYLKGMKKAGMAATGKHFPGHGWVELDSHVAMPIDERSLEEIAARDMSVFASLMPQLSAIMTAHILYPEVDDVIATYSTKWLNVLRQDLGFNGIIISDDLGMEGCVGVGSVTTRAEKAVSAGCDVLLACNNRAAVLELLDSNQSWTMTRSLDGLRAKTGRGYHQLTDDAEYQRILQRWQMLLD